MSVEDAWNEFKAILRLPCSFEDFKAALVEDANYLMNSLGLPEQIAIHKSVRKFIWQYKNEPVTVKSRWASVYKNRPGVLWVVRLRQSHGLNSVFDKPTSDPQKTKKRKAKQKGLFD